MTKKKIQKPKKAPKEPITTTHELTKTLKKKDKKVMKTPEVLITEGTSMPERLIDNVQGSRVATPAGTFVIPHRNRYISKKRFELSGFPRIVHHSNIYFDLDSSNLSSEIRGKAPKVEDDSKTQVEDGKVRTDKIDIEVDEDKGTDKDPVVEKDDAKVNKKKEIVIDGKVYFEG